MRERKLVYIASPYSGDRKQNTEFAKSACRYAMNQGVIPIAVHLLYPQFLDDQCSKERNQGIQMGIRILKACDELWICGDHISQGMQQEIDMANRLGIPMKTIPTEQIQQEILAIQMRTV